MKEKEIKDGEPQVEQQDAASTFWQEIKYDAEKTESER